MLAVHEPPRPAAASQPPPDHAARFVAAVEDGLADLEAGRVIDDDELTRELDQEFGPLA